MDPQLEAKFAKISNIDDRISAKADEIIRLLKLLVGEDTETVPQETSIVHQRFDLSGENQLVEDSIDDTVGIEVLSNSEEEELEETVDVVVAPHGPQKSAQEEFDQMPQRGTFSSVSYLLKGVDQYYFQFDSGFTGNKSLPNVLIDQQLEYPISVPHCLVRYSLQAVEREEHKGGLLCFDPGIYSTNAIVHIIVDVGTFNVSAFEALKYRIDEYDAKECNTDMVFTSVMFHRCLLVQLYDTGWGWLWFTRDNQEVHYMGITEEIMWDSYNIVLSDEREETISMNEVVVQILIPELCDVVRPLCPWDVLVPSFRVEGYISNDLLLFLKEYLVVFLLLLSQFSLQPIKQDMAVHVFTVRHFHMDHWEYIIKVVVASAVLAAEVTLQVNKILTIRLIFLAHNEWLMELAISSCYSFYSNIFSEYDRFGQLVRQYISQETVLGVNLIVLIVLLRTSQALEELLAVLAEECRRLDKQHCFCMVMVTDSFSIKTRMQRVIDPRAQPVAPNFMVANIRVFPSSKGGYGVPEGAVCPLNNMALIDKISWFWSAYLTTSFSNLNQEEQHTHGTAEFVLGDVCLLVVSTSQKKLVANVVLGQVDNFVPFPNQHSNGEAGSIKLKLGSALTNIAEDAIPISGSIFFPQKGARLKDTTSIATGFGSSKCRIQEQILHSLISAIYMRFSHWLFLRIGCSLVYSAGYHQQFDQYHITCSAALTIARLINLANELVLSSIVVHMILEMHKYVVGLGKPSWCFDPGGLILRFLRLNVVFSLWCLDTGIFNIQVLQLHLFLVLDSRYRSIEAHTGDRGITSLRNSIWQSHQGQEVHNTMSYECESAVLNHIIAGSDLLLSLQGNQVILMLTAALGIRSFDPGIPIYAQFCATHVGKLCLGLLGPYVFHRVYIISEHFGFYYFLKVVPFTTACIGHYLSAIIYKPFSYRYADLGGVRACRVLVRVQQLMENILHSPYSEVMPESACFPELSSLMVFLWLIAWANSYTLLCLNVNWNMDKNNLSSKSLGHQSSWKCLKGSKSMETYNSSRVYLWTIACYLLAQLRIGQYFRVVISSHLNHTVAYLHCPPEYAILVGLLMATKRKGQKASLLQQFSRDDQSLQYLGSHQLDTINEFHVSTNVGFFSAASVTIQVNSSQISKHRPHLQGSDEFETLKLLYSEMQALGCFLWLVATWILVSFLKLIAWSTETGTIILTIIEGQGSMTYTAVIALFKKKLVCLGLHTISPTRYVDE